MPQHFCSAFRVANLNSRVQKCMLSWPAEFKKACTLRTTVNTYALPQQPTKWTCRLGGQLMNTPPPPLQPISSKLLESPCRQRPQALALDFHTAIFVRNFMPFSNGLVESTVLPCSLVQLHYCNKSHIYLNNHTTWNHLQCTCFYTSYSFTLI